MDGDEVEKGLGDFTEAFATAAAGEPPKGDAPEEKPPEEKPVVAEAGGDASGGEAPKVEPEPEPTAKEKELLAQVEAMKGRLELLEKPAPKAEEKPKEPEKVDMADFLKDITKGLDAETLEGLQAYEADVDSVSKFEGLKRELTAKKIIEYVHEKIAEVISAVAPIVQANAEFIQSAHYKAIKDAHADFEDLRDKGTIKAWIGTQPDKDNLMKTYTDGKTVEVIGLITKYKAATKKPDPKPEDGTKKVAGDAVDNLLVVKNKKGAAPPGTTPMVVPSDDFGGAFREATGG